MAAAQHCPTPSNRVKNCSGPNCFGQTQTGFCAPDSATEDCGEFQTTCCGTPYTFGARNGVFDCQTLADCKKPEDKAIGRRVIVGDQAKDTARMMVFGGE